MNRADPGLQPERTVLAWARTTLALIVASMLFLRWAADHGWFPFVLVLIAMATAFVVYLTQGVRYRRAAGGITRGTMPPAVLGALCLSTTVVFLAGLGLFITLFLPVG